MNRRKRMDSRAKQQFAQQPPAARLGDEPIEEAYHGRMTCLVRQMDHLFNGDLRGELRTTGFVLMVFRYGDTSGRCNYMSNGASRDDIVTLMKEMIARFEGQPEQSGSA